jgi:hypothetical protein
VFSCGLVRCDAFSCGEIKNRREQVASALAELEKERDEARQATALAKEDKRKADEELTKEKQRAVAAEKGLDNIRKQVENEREALAHALKEKDTSDAKRNDMKRQLDDLIQERNHALQRAEELQQRSLWSMLPCYECVQPVCSRWRRSSQVCWPLYLLRRQHFQALSGRGTGGPDRIGSFDESDPAIEAAPPTNPLREPQRRVELINALIATEWKFVSQWFEEQMRNVVEPLLQESLKSVQGPLSLVTIRIGHSCDLGHVPAAFEDIVTQTCTEATSDGSEDIENMQIVGRLDYHGNGIVDVNCSGAGMASGHIMMTGLQLKGIVVIELVKLTHAPPWFSGVRIFFPNRPEVNITMSSKVSSLNVNIPFNFESIKESIIQALDEKVLTRSAVLPNRVCVNIGDRMEEFCLRHPRPQGVLRLQLLRAQVLGRAGSGGSWWSAKEANPYAVITLGAQSYQTRECGRTTDPDWGDAEVVDLLVTDFGKQTLRITVRDADCGFMSGKTSDFLGIVERPLAEFEGKNQEMTFALSSESEHGWMPIGGSVGKVWLRAQWRPFAQISEFSTAMTQLRSWDVGASGSDFLLSADLFYASGLPECVADTEHWATVTVTGHKRSLDSSSPQKSVQETWVASAAGSLVHGAKAVGGIPNVAEVLCDDEKRELGRRMWRKKVTLVEDAENPLSPRPLSSTDIKDNGRKLVDVVWNCPLQFMMDKVQGVTIKISVWRPKAGKKKPSSWSAADVKGAKNGSVCLGSVERELTYEDLREKMRMDLHCPLVKGMAAGRGASIKVSLQVCALLPPCEVSVSSQTGPVGLSAAVAEWVGKNVMRTTTIKSSADHDGNMSPCSELLGTASELLGDSPSRIDKAEDDKNRELAIAEDATDALIEPEPTAVGITKRWFNFWPSPKTAPTENSSIEPVNGDEDSSLLPVNGDGRDDDRDRLAPELNLDIGVGEPEAEPLESGTTSPPAVPQPSGFQKLLRNLWSTSKASGSSTALSNEPPGALPNELDENSADDMSPASGPTVIKQSYSAPAEGLATRDHGEEPESIADAFPAADTEFPGQPIPRGSSWPGMTWPRMALPTIWSWRSGARAKDEEAAAHDDDSSDDAAESPEHELLPTSPLSKHCSVDSDAYSPNSYRELPEDFSPTSPARSDRFVSIDADRGDLPTSHRQKFLLSRNMSDSALVAPPAIHEQDATAAQISAAKPESQKVEERALEKAQESGGWLAASRRWMFGQDRKLPDSNKVAEVVEAKVVEEEETSEEIKVGEAAEAWNVEETPCIQDALGALCTQDCQAALEEVAPLATSALELTDIIPDAPQSVSVEIDITEPPVFQGQSDSTLQSNREEQSIDSENTQVEMTVCKKDVAHANEHGDSADATQAAPSKEADSFNHGRSVIDTGNNMEQLTRQFLNEAAELPSDLNVMVESTAVDAVQHPHSGYNELSDHVSGEASDMIASPQQLDVESSVADFDTPENHPTMLGTPSSVSPERLLHLPEDITEGAEVQSRKEAISATEGDGERNSEELEGASSHEEKIQERLEDSSQHPGQTQEETELEPVEEEPRSPMLCRKRAR